MQNFLADSSVKMVAPKLPGLSWEFASKEGTVAAYCTLGLAMLSLRHDCLEYHKYLPVTSQPERLGEVSVIK
jgi:hypothetical protein